MQRDDDEDRPASAEDTGLEVGVGFFPLAWILLFCTPRVEINGRETRRPWGTHFFRVGPGRYEVAVWFPYLFWSKCGYNSRTVEVHPGEATRVRFYMWPFVLLPGSMSVSHGRRSQATRNDSGSAPMNKTGIWVGLAALALLAVTPFVCCCGVGMLGNLTSAAHKRALEDSLKSKGTGRPAEEQRPKQDPRVAMNDFWAKFTLQGWPAAYAMTSREFKTRVSAERFQTLVRNHLIEQPIGLEVRLRETTIGNRARYEFEYENRQLSGGAGATDARLILVDEDGSWKVDNVEFWK